MLGSELPSITWVSGDEDSPSCLLGVCSISPDLTSLFCHSNIALCFFSISIYVNSLKSNFFFIAPIMMSIFVHCLLYGKAKNHVSSLYRILKTLSPLSISFFCFSPLPVSSLLSGHTSSLSSIDGNIYLSSLHTEILSRAHCSTPLTLYTWPALAPRSPLTSQPSGQAGSPHNSLQSPEPPASAHMLLEASVPFHMHSLPPDLATSSAETKAKGKAP